MRPTAFSSWPHPHTPLKETAGSFLSLDFIPNFLLLHPCAPSDSGDGFLLISGKSSDSFFRGIGRTMYPAEKQPFFCGWVIVATCFMAATSYGLFYTFGVFFKSLQAEFGWGRALTGSVHSVHLVIYAFSTYFFGRLTRLGGFAGHIN